MLQRYLLFWLVVSSLIAGIWPDVFGDDAYDPVLASKAGLSWIVATVMFCVGTLLPADEVKYVAGKWPTILGGTFIQYSSMPFLAWAIATSFGFSDDLKVGVIMVGCVPGAMASNVLTMVARGNVSYSVGLTTSATLLSPLVVPVILKLTLGAAADRALLLNASLRLILEVVIPVISGFALCQLSQQVKRLADKFSGTIANFSILWIIAIVVALNRDAIREMPVLLITGLLLINLGGFLSGQFGGRLLRLDAGMRRALMLEVGMQNAGVGASLARGLFPDNPEISLPCGLFAFGCMTTGTILAEVVSNDDHRQIATTSTATIWKVNNHMELSDAQIQQLEQLGRTLVDQQRARVIVPPYENSSGFWFGGGNMIESVDGDLYLVGRYRNFGDSRTGVGSGERGLELAIFKSADRGESFSKILSWDKSDLVVNDLPVLSIEGSAFHWTCDGVELFVSTEKGNVGYPDGYSEFLKPGTGVWSIDRIKAKDVDEIKGATVEPVWSSDDLNHLHVKDPFVYEASDGDATLFCCTHPFTWSSSNTAFLDPHGEPVYDFFPRGASWDVAMTRGTAFLDVPMIGAFSDADVTLLFYDGGECVRDLDQHKSGVQRPRGYSCEELGGLACFAEGDLSQVQRISKFAPMFVSPHGTGCSRYVDVLVSSEGLYVTWQQSQTDGSQPLVMNFVSHGEIEQILA